MMKYYWSIKLAITICLVLITSILKKTNGISGESGNYISHQWKYANNKYERAIKHHLKWVTNRDNYPVWMEKMKKLDADYKWYKYSEQMFVDEIYDYQRFYLYTDGVDTTKLFILNYDDSTHEQLSTYEPRIIGIRNPIDARSDENSRPREHGSHVTDDRDIFTLAYLKSHRIRMEKNEHSMNISCSVVVIIPQNSDEINEIVYKLLESNIIIKMKMAEPVRHGHHNRHNRHNHHHNQRHNRHSNRAKRQYPYSHGQDDYDSMNNLNEKLHLTTFIEVELREGPITLHKTFGSKHDYENVSCALDLIDYDQTYAYQNSIFRVIHRNDPSDADTYDNGQVDDENASRNGKDSEHDRRVTTTPHPTIHRNRKPTSQVTSCYSKFSMMFALSSIAFFFSLYFSII